MKTKTRSDENGRVCTDCRICGRLLTEVSIMLIIGVGFKKSRGKDTACNLLKDWLSENRPELKVKKLGFADKLKDIAYQLYSWAGLQPGEYYEGANYNLKEVVLPLIGMSARDLWIGVGNRLREVYEDTWIAYALYGVKADVVLIKDLGYPNEGEAIVRAGGFCYNITRSDQPFGTDGREVSLDGWPKFTDTLENNGTLRDLRSTVIQKIGMRHWSE